MSENFFLKDNIFLILENNLQKILAKKS